jgi:TldD protein
LKNGYGSYKYDDEGVPGQKVKLVENGILKGFLHSRLTAGRIGKFSNGHARCGIEEDDLEFLPPSPRMSNLVIKPTVRLSRGELNRKFVSLISKSPRKCGIYCRGFRGGSVEPESGKNEIYPLEVFRIRDNGVTERVKDAYIIGTPFLLINKIVACGEIEKGAGGYCSAESGRIPTDEIAPSAIFENVEFAREPKRNERRPFLPKPRKSKYF